MLAILLAAGKGQRLGGPKALLDLGGRTALERCHAALRAGGIERQCIVLSPQLAASLAVGPLAAPAGRRLPEVRGDGAGAAPRVAPGAAAGTTGGGAPGGSAGGAGGAIPDVAAWNDVDWVINPRPERGQTSSLRCALAAVSPAQDFVLHTVDHPLVRAVDVRALLAAFARRGPGQLLVAPSVAGRRGHPCVHAAALGPEFLALADDEPAHRIIRRDAARVLHVPLADPWLVRDLDTAEDLQAARTALAADPSR